MIEGDAGSRCAAAQGGESISGAQAAPSVCPSSVGVQMIALGRRKHFRVALQRAHFIFGEKVAENQKAVLIAFLELQVCELHRYVSSGELAANFPPREIEAI